MMLSHDAARPEGEAIIEPVSGVARYDIVDPAAGLVRCSHRRVAIIGAGPGRRDAPWGDPTYCWQALNEIAMPGWYSRHWEMHPMALQSDAE